MAFLNPLVLTMAGEWVESLSLTLVMMREEGRVDIMPDIGDNRVSLTHCAGNIHSHTNTQDHLLLLNKDVGWWWPFGGGRMAPMGFLPHLIQGFFFWVFRNVCFLHLQTQASSQTTNLSLCVISFRASCI